jgi:hypothetical protein
MKFSPQLQKIDAFVSYVIIAAGVLQLLGTFVFFKSAEEPAFWFFNGGITLLLVGGLNLLRSKYGKDIPLIRRFSLAANLFLTVFWLAMAAVLTYKFVRYPFAALPLVALLAASGLALRK